MDQGISIFWFRRDLRLHDNTALLQALTSGHWVQPIFIFDTEILSKLDDKADRRVDLIHRELCAIKQELERLGSTLLVFHATPLEAFAALTTQFEMRAVHANRDHEPYAIQRDAAVAEFLATKGIGLVTAKDHTIFERNEVVKDDGTPYLVFTPYSKRWLAQLTDGAFTERGSMGQLSALRKTPPQPMPTLADIGFLPTDVEVPNRVPNLHIIDQYHETRDLPAVLGTSKMSVHLRFGTVSIRQLVRLAQQHNQKYLMELVWREFYQMILWHFPKVDQAFKPAYDRIKWENNEAHFEAWCQGRTGYPLVDAGMRELNATGLMHNRVRMVVASFLTKHLLIDWRWGEAYFAQKLLDFDLASNNGGWQWASGSGCDAAPYFRVFNPSEQARKFDPEAKYIRKWVPEFDQLTYVQPIVDHAWARNRSLARYKETLGSQPKTNHLL